MPRKPTVKKSQVEAKISKLAVSALPDDAQGGLVQYEQEASYVEGLRQQIAADQAAFNFVEGVDKHTWRKGVLGCLFGMTCFWLLCVIAIVCLSATSPSLSDRKEFLALQVAYPNAKARFCPVLF